MIQLTRGLKFEIDKLYWRAMARFIKPTPNYPIEGLPDGITFDLVNKLSNDHLNDTLLKISYNHISAWKNTGAYRLFLETKKGTKWSLIYKQSIYSLEEIPALSNLPVTPGISEYAIYNNLEDKFQKYLPKIYFCCESIPNQKYQYLLEDLRGKYHPIYPKDSQFILEVVKKLPRFYCIINNYSFRIPQSSFLKYNYNFSIQLQTYLVESLEEYIKVTGDRIVSQFFRQWNLIEKVHLRQEFYDLQIPCFIHGDFNFSNIMIDRNNPSRFKLIDWEWAGWGDNHADLASLLQLVSPDLEEEALKIFSQKNKSLSWKNHKRLYEWCQLERGLLNAAFCAKQFIQSQNGITKLNLPRFIEISLYRAMRAYKNLR